MTNAQPEHLSKQLAQDQKLLDAVKTHLPQLEKLLVEMLDVYEDGIYRFYYQSFKVYRLQNYTFRAAELIRNIGRGAEKQCCKWFEEIIAGGTGIEFEVKHNENWPQHTRPIVEAFLHSKYFVEMMVRYGHEMELAPSLLPSGWAAILTLYGQR